MSAPGASPHGIVIVDKPSGPTSHDVVARARRHFGTRRIGHAGTLDPMATGVLVLLLGEATKLCDVATRGDKTYVAELHFGRATDSHDAEGATTAEQVLEPGWLDSEKLRVALATEAARDSQVPPAVSAIKVQGRRSYRLARKGLAPELAPRSVRVHSLALLAASDQLLELELSVSKGYYVRALVRDLAGALGVPAHLSRLRRIRSGGFSLDEACRWPPDGSARLIPIREALPRLLETWRLSAPGIERARQGKVLTRDDFLEPPTQADASNTPDTFAWTDAEGNPVALGRREGDIFRVQRGFVADTGSAADVDVSILAST